MYRYGQSGHSNQRPTGSDARPVAAEKEFRKAQIHNLADQSDAMEASVELTKQTVKQNAETVKAMQAQSEAMIGQLKVMQDTLKANRDSVDLTWEGLKTQKRAYLGTNRMNIDLVKKKRLAIYLVNIGKSPATQVKAKIMATLSTPDHWHQQQPKNVRMIALGEEEYEFNLTAINPDSIPVRLGFPLGKHFSEQELTLVVQKKSRLTVNVTLDYHDGFDNSFSSFNLTYRGKDSHGYDSWGIFPTDSEKEYDQTNPEHPEWKIL
jgi:hypothetical protein